MDAVIKHKMSLTLPSDVEFRMSRAFEAPPGLVFRAFTEPKHLKQWYGCICELQKCEVDLTVDGGYRYALAGANGMPPGVIFGVYREIVTGARLVYTQGYVTEGFLSPNALTTTTFDEKGGVTTLTTNVWHNSQADRDLHLKSGVEHGASATFDNLETYLRTMN